MQGTAGSLTNLEVKNELLLIIMGDLLFNVDLKKFVSFHKKNKKLAELSKLFFLAPETAS